jgi:hypothetical protein
VGAVRAWLVAVSSLVIHIEVGPFRLEQSSEAVAAMLAITECLPESPVPVSVRLDRYAEPGALDVPPVDG